MRSSDTPKRTRLLPALKIFLVTSFIFSFISHTQAAEQISCSNTGPDTVICRIDQPNVRQRMTE